MGMFTESAVEAQKERETFKKEFSERVGEAVESMELAEFRADVAVYREQNLKTYRPSVWGLLILCSKSIYYYVAPQESYLSFFMKGAGKTDEKLLKLTDLSGLTLVAPKQGFFSFLNPELARSVEASYDSLSGGKRYFTLVLNHKADSVLQAMLGKLAD